MRSNTTFPDKPFAIWITGLPASGKSTIAHRLLTELRESGLTPVALESDVLRPILTPEPEYTICERDYFYAALVDLGALIFEHGVPVIFDATAHLRRYRRAAEERISPFFEVLVHTPLSVCRERDPKGIYRKAEAGEADTVPGMQVEYEAPANPAVELDGEAESPSQGVARIMRCLRKELSA